MLDNSGKYLDSAFPPTQDSLIKGDPSENVIDLFPSEIDMLNSSEFRRLSDIEGKNVAIFNGIDPNDIIQGELGNCYYLSAVSALAEFPKRVEKCFSTHDNNDYCKYTVRLCIQG